MFQETKVTLASGFGEWRQGARRMLPMQCPFGVRCDVATGSQGLVLVKDGIPVDLVVIGSGNLPVEC